MHTDTVTIVTASGPMDAFLAHPGSSVVPAPAVVVFQEGYGVNGHIRDVCRRLAREGFVALAPELFHRRGRGVTFGYGEREAIRPVFASLTNDDLAADMRSAVSYLKSLSDVIADRVSAIGFCLGGFVTFMTACRVDVQSAVAFYGGGIAEARPGLQMEPVLDEAANLRGSLLCLFGAEDPSIPAAQVQAIRERLAAVGPQHEVVVYEGATHGFFCDERPAYNAGAAADGWKRALDWIRRPAAARAD